MALNKPYLYFNA